MQTKKCAKCGQTKELTEFYKSPRHSKGVSHWCKTCFKAYSTLRTTNVQVTGSKTMKRNGYVLTVEDYNALLDEQAGCCGICGEHTDNLKKRLSVDHCHKTGKIRGLLCVSCNFLLGFAKDDLDILASAASYLQNAY